MENFISSYIPEICFKEIEEIDKKSQFFNDLITYFHRNKLPMSIVENGRLTKNVRIRFYLSKRNIKLIGNIEFYETFASYVRELMINFLFLPESEKIKIKEGDV